MFRSRLTSLLSFIWLTLGYGVAHALFASWLISLVQGFWGNDYHYENVTIVDDGEPLIGIQGRHVDIHYRKLDGTPVTDTLGFKMVYPVDLSSGIRGEPLSWENRIQSFADLQIPSTNWYLIAPPDHPGFAYFVGYDPKSFQQIGYLDISGFSIQKPSADRLFPITPGRYGFNGSVAQTMNVRWYSTPSEPPDMRNRGNITLPSNAPIDGVWILSEGNLYEVRLGSRTIRTVIKDRPDMRTLTQLTVTEENKPRLQLLVRTDSGLLIIDPADYQYQTVLLDPLPPYASDSYCQLSNGTRLLVRNLPFKHLSVISWLDTDGKVARREDVSLPNDSNNDTMTMLGVLSLGLIAPSPIIPLAALAIVPITMDESEDLITSDGSEDHSYPSRFLKFLATFKLWIAVSLLIGATVGWASRRREIEVFGTTSWFWPVLVGACGWFGWIGYICLRPLPAQLPGRQWMPAQPQPNQPLGTEIFA